MKVKLYFTNQLSQRRDIGPSKAPFEDLMLLIDRVQSKWSLLNFDLDIEPEPVYLQRSI